MSPTTRPGACRAFVTVCLLLGSLPEPHPSQSASAPSHQAPVSDAALPSWNTGAARTAIVDFVRRVTTQGGPDFVAPAERIAVFDNDGTLWAEQPIYFQFAFALDRVKELLPSHPQWKDDQPFKAVIEGDMKTVAASGEKGIMQILAATTVGSTTVEFENIVRKWIESATHPTTNRPYTEMVYQPMLEVLGYLRANQFKTYIVSGGGVEFIRPWVERVYGIPAEQVVGSRIKVRYNKRPRPIGPELVRLPDIDLIDDGPGKPVGIHQVIGRRPIAAFGNSDGDFEMLEWTTSAEGPRLGMIVHHTDATREWAYDRASSIGKLARGLDEAPARGWIVIDMQKDWRAIFPPVVRSDRR